MSRWHGTRVGSTGLIVEANQVNSTLRNLFAEAAMPIDMMSDLGHGMVAHPVPRLGSITVACTGFVQQLDTRNGTHKADAELWE